MRLNVRIRTRSVSAASCYLSTHATRVSETTNGPGASPEPLSLITFSTGDPGASEAADMRSAGRSAFALCRLAHTFAI